MLARMFARLFAEEAEEMGAARRFVHEAGAKCCIGWAGGAAFPTDRSLGAKAKAYVPVVTLPFSDKLWAGGFCDMKQKPRREGRMRAFGEFGGAPRMRAPDNAAAATDRTNAPRVALANKEHGRFADRRGAAVVPARVRRPRDESVAESCVDQVGQWIIGPAGEMAFYTIDELNGFCAERAARLDPRPFSAKDGPRDPVSEEEEETRLMPLPAERYEMCERRGAEVSPDCHATVDCMRYPVEHSLVGGQADVKPTPSAATVVRGGEIVAARPRLHGRKGQCPAVEDHMPEKRAALDSPRSPARLTSRARRIGPETEAAIGRALESRPIVGQPFVSCRNIPGLPKTCTPGLLERAPR